MKVAIGTTLQGLVDGGIKIPYTEKELKAYCVNIPKVQVESAQIKFLRAKIKWSQIVRGKQDLNTFAE